MNNDSAPMNSELLRWERNTPVCTEETRIPEEQVEFSITVLGEAWPRRQASAREFALLPPHNLRQRGEIILSGTQLMVVVGSALASIFLVVWAVTKLWLSHS